MQNKKSFFLIAAPLLLILFIDGMGLGLVIPVLNALLDPQSSFLTSDFARHYHNFIFGLVIGIFMFSWFLGAAILGDLSDQIGRKKSLLICLIGAFLGYLFNAFAVTAGSFILLLLGRIIAGLTSGSQPIAQAAIVDLSAPEDKARNIGYILLALSLGFILGPLFGGILSNNHIVSWFSLATPFYFAALLSFINSILLALILKESLVVKGKFKVKLVRAWEIFKSAFEHEKIRYLSVIFLFFVLGWSSFYSFISLYLVKEYHFSAAEISLFMAVMGAGFAVGNGWLVNFFAKRFRTMSNAIGGILLSALLTIIMLMGNHAFYLWILMGPMATAVSIVYSSILTLFSDQVSSEEQGWVMGITGAIMALVWGIVAFFVGLLATWSVQLPLILTVISFIATSLLMYAAVKKGELVLDK